MGCMTHVCTECADRWSDNKPVSVCRYCSGSHVIHLFDEAVARDMRAAAAEIERLRSEQVAICRLLGYEDDALELSSLEQLARDALAGERREIERLRADLKTALDAASAGGSWWSWQGDGEDHLESLTCPILIRAEQMREIQAEIERLRAIVDRLPKTADGVPVVPGDRVWCNGIVRYRNGAELILTASKQTVGVTLEGDGEFVGLSYSTREAASAAKEGDDDDDD